MIFCLELWKKRYMYMLGECKEAEREKDRKRDGRGQHQWVDRPHTIREHLRTERHGGSWVQAFSDTPVEMTMGQVKVKVMQLYHTVTDVEFTGVKLQCFKDGQHKAYPCTWAHAFLLCRVMQAIKLWTAQWKYYFIIDVGRYQTQKLKQNITLLLGHLVPHIYQRESLVWLN